jgi:hypothetical protein
MESFICVQCGVQIYGGWKANVLVHAKAAVARSGERYLRAIGHSARSD